MSLTPEQAGLLASFADGPRIWDAASLQPDLAALQDAGLIELAPGAYAAMQLTEAGHTALRGLQAAAANVSIGGQIIGTTRGDTPPAQRSTPRRTDTP